MKFLTAVFFFFSAAVFAEEEIIVHLNRSEPLVPLYLGTFDATQSSLKPDYVEKLEGVLRFDLDYSGRMEICGRHHEKEGLLLLENKKEGFAHSVWKRDKISYVVSASVEADKLNVSVFSVDFQKIKHIKGIELTGDLGKDRRSIHRLSDHIHKICFNKEGISTTKVLYTVQVPNEKKGDNKYLSHIFECDYDGHNAQKLTEDPKYCITPIYYPKSTLKPQQFLYVTYEDGPSKIYISTIGNHKPEPFIKLRGNQLLPTISKDNSKIAFICDAGGRADLFVQPLHPERGLLGKPIQAYSFPSSVQASPSFSPDGKKIAFVSDKEGTPKIYLIDAPKYKKGRKLPDAVCLTKKNRENTCPSWSPDGTKLAYSAKTKGTRQIWIYDFDTNEERQLTSGTSHKENPCWAPNSFHIVFNTADATSSELHLVNLNQDKTIKISNGPGKKHYPSWQP
ncbi:MAG: Tol-Pal system protein TolB [Chlamydiia bacterium]|nr:Tol-Pal system protein TolB [Chlamydiia bacterium]